MSSDLIERVEYLLRRGMTLNNPKINFNNAKAYAESIDMSEDLPSQLRELVRQYPLADEVQAASASGGEDEPSPVQ